MALERRLKLVTTGEAAPEVDILVRVAFATSDMKRVDQHFGAAEAFAVYALNPEQTTLVEVAQFGLSVMDGYENAGSARGPAGTGESGPRTNGSGRNENKLAAKIDALDGCIAVYCRAVGASAINQLRIKGIQVVKVSESAEIRGLIDALQSDLRTGASTWLARAVARHEPGGARRFDDMEQEGWVE